MSNISLLSNQYKQLVTASDSVNQSVVTLKKESLLHDFNIKKQHPKLNVTPEELREARNVLLDFLDNVRHLLENDYMDSGYIPPTVLEDYKQRLKSNPYIREDLASLITRLQHNQSPSEEDMKVFDSLVSILDIERSTLFRKLRTARG